MDYHNTEFIKDFFYHLNKKNVAYFVIGDYSYLPKSTGQSDIDIYVDEKDLSAFHKVFKKLLADYNSKIVSSHSSSNGMLLFRVMGFFKDKWWGIAIDVINQGFIYDNKIYFPVKKARENIINHNGIRVLKKEISYVSSFLKELLFTGRVKRKYIDMTRKQIVSNKKYLKPIIVSLYGLEFWQLMQESLTENDINNINLKKLAKIGRNSLYKNSFDKIRCKLQKMSNLQRITNKPGYSIVFLGVDGSGKSTIIKEILPLFRITFNKMVRYEHFRPNYLLSISKLLGKGSVQNTSVREPQNSSSSGFLGSLIRWTYYLSDYTFGYLIKVLPQKTFKSCIWIFDRYYYDYHFDPKRSRINLPDFILKIGQKIIPEPDIIICLGTDAQTIYGRKAELPLREIDRQVKELKKFSKRHPQAVWVDTGGSISKSTNDTLKAIYEMMVNRFRF